MRTTSRTQVAVVGYGYWGSKHVRVLASMPEVVVTVVDSDTERIREAAATYPSVATAHRVEEVVDDVDAVVVATPPSGHSAIALDVLRAGRHTLVEKPLATSVPDARQLVHAAHDSGARLMVGHTFEYNAAVWKLKEIIDSGELGKVLYIDAARLSLGRYQRDCDVIWDLAPHDISIVSFLLDEPPRGVAVWAKRNIGHLHADVAYLRLEFERSHAHAFVHVSWLDPWKVRRVTVVGEQKMAVYDDLSDNERIRVYDIGVDLNEVDDSTGAHAMPVSYRTGGIVSPFVQFNEPLLVQDSHFIDCVRSGRTPDTPGERGLDVVRVLTAADTARISGRPARVTDSEASSEPSMLRQVAS